MRDSSERVWLLCAAGAGNCACGSCFSARRVWEKVRRRIGWPRSLVAENFDRRSSAGGGSTGTKLGIEAKGYMDQGQLVPDSVVIGLVRDKLAEPTYAKGFILDGFPRTVPQAEELGKVLREQGMQLDRVVNFQVSP